MNLNFLANEFRQAGWKNMQPGTFTDTEFDLIGYRPAGVTKMHVFIKYMDLLDGKVATKWQENFKTLFQKIKPGFFKSEGFALCLLADEIEAVGIRIVSNNFGDATRKLVIVDTQNHNFFGDLDNSMKVPVFNGPKQSLKKLLLESLPKAVWSD